VHEHRRDLQRGHQRVDANTAHANQKERRVLHNVPQLSVRDRRLQRAGEDEQQRKVRPDHQPLVAGSGHVQPTEQFRRRGAGRHDIRGRRFQRGDHYSSGGVLQRPYGRVVRTRRWANGRSSWGEGELSERTRREPPRLCIRLFFSTGIQYKQ